LYGRFVSESAISDEKTRGGAGLGLKEREASMEPRLRQNSEGLKEKLKKRGSDGEGWTRGLRTGKLTFGKMSKSDQCGTQNYGKVSSAWATNAKNGNGGMTRTKDKKKKT